MCVHACMYMCLCERVQKEEVVEFSVYILRGGNMKSSCAGILRRIWSTFKLELFKRRPGFRLIKLLVRLT